MLITIINDLFWLYTTLIAVYVLMSWFPGAYNTWLGRTLAKICEPYLSLFNFIPPILGISFAPWVALIVLQFIQLGVIAIVNFI